MTRLVRRDLLVLLEGSLFGLPQLLVANWTLLHTTRDLRNGRAHRISKHAIPVLQAFRYRECLAFDTAVPCLYEIAI